MLFYVYYVFKSVLCENPKLFFFKITVKNVNNNELT